MSISLQSYFSKVTKSISADLEKAYYNIPPDKRAWRPEGKGRSAIDQLAEVAIINFNTAYTLAHKARPADFDVEEYYRKKSALTADESAAVTRFHESVPAVLAAIEALADEDLEFEIQFPWGLMTLAEVMSYPDYNMSYHEGQINYIASLLGVL